MKKILLSLICLFFISTSFAAYNGNPGRIMVSSRSTHGATTAVLSNMTIGYIDFGAAYLTGSAPASYTAFTAPQSGVYRFQFGGAKCGVDAGTEEVIDTRSGSGVVYDQTKTFADQDCTSFDGDFIVVNVLAGDVFTFKLQENNALSVVTSITDNTVQVQGNFKVYILQTYP
jgi:hypothetical protein